MSAMVLNVGGCLTITRVPSSSSIYIYRICLDLFRNLLAILGMAMVGPPCSALQANCTRQTSTDVVKSSRDSRPEYIVRGYLWRAKHPDAPSNVIHPCSSTVERPKFFCLENSRWRNDNLGNDKSVNGRAIQLVRK